MKQYNVAPLKEYSDFIMEMFNPTSLAGSKEFEEVISHREIANAKSLLEKQPISLGEDNASEAMNTQQYWTLSKMLQKDSVTIEETILKLKLFGKIVEALTKLNGKGVIYVVRRLIRVFLEDSNTFKAIVNFNLASHLYRLFVVIVQGDFSRTNLDKVFGPDSTTQVLLTLFEVCLFNKQAIKEVKSGALLY